MKKLIILLIICMPVLIFAQGLEGDVGLLYTLANGQLTSDGTNTYYELDVMLQASETGTRLGTGIVFLSYSSAFSTMISYSGNLNVTMGTLLQSPFPPLPFYDIYVLDSLPSVFAVTFEFLQVQGFGTQIPTSATQLLHVKMEIQNPDDPIQVCIWPDEMPGETFYDDEWTWYSPIDVGGCLYHDPPTPVELSYFNCMMNNMHDAVNLTWVTQTETNMVGYRLFRGNSANLNEAIDLNTMIGATNTSQPCSYMYQDNEIQPESVYNYWLEAMEMNGASEYYGPVTISTPAQTVSTPVIPLITGLDSLYPNPFNPELTIGYTLEKAQRVQITIANSRGQVIRTLTDTNQAKGSHRLIWDGKDESGNECPSGVFFVKMIAGNKDYNRKAILMK